MKRTVPIAAIALLVASCATKPEPKVSKSFFGEEISPRDEASAEESAPGSEIDIGIGLVLEMPPGWIEAEPTPHAALLFKSPERTQIAVFAYDDPDGQLLARARSQHEEYATVHGVVEPFGPRRHASVEMYSGHYRIERSNSSTEIWIAEVPAEGRFYRVVGAASRPGKSPVIERVFDSVRLKTPTNPDALQAEATFTPPMQFSRSSSDAYGSVDLPRELGGRWESVDDPSKPSLVRAWAHPAPASISVVRFNFASEAAAKTATDQLAQDEGADGIEIVDGPRTASYGNVEGSLVEFDNPHDGLRALVWQTAIGKTMWVFGLRGSKAAVRKHRGTLETLIESATFSE